ncbi:MAG: PASTA domain-containing protein [Clostridiales bacterium]|nr:PASTA domain-containing protein [Clostridiales bacterium]
MKKLSLALISVLIVCSLVGCGNRITIPDVSDLDESSAKSILSSNGLIPKVEYIYDDNITDGNVIKTSPEIGSTTTQNSQITVYVSKGPSYFSSKDAIISWYNISSSEDYWEFSKPYNNEGILYIDCDVTFGTEISWSDSYQNGKIIGQASLTDTFDKAVPISAVYQKQNWEAYESQSFILEIPLSDFNENRPSNIHLRLFAYMGNENINVRINFSITW